MTVAKFALLAALIAGPAQAETVYSLSESEIDSVVTAPAADRGTAEVVVPRDRRVHGEVSMGIGTGGYRSLGGSALVPLSNDSWAMFGFDTGQFNQPRFRRR